MPSVDVDPAEARAAEAAAAGAEGKGAYVRGMFSAIAPRYDLLNRVLSLRIDTWWRKRAIRRLGLERTPDGTVLDLCAGTLDVGAQLVRTAGFRGRVLGADFAEPMLRHGLGKAPRERLAPVAADALCSCPSPTGCSMGPSWPSASATWPTSTRGCARCAACCGPAPAS
jgi:demethylmenaquinone methyltransferase / 2-methoxy-6-polyprenyl-1,4-benzoquinol methylase